MLQKRKHLSIYHEILYPSHRVHSRSTLQPLLPPLSYISQTHTNTFQKLLPQNSYHHKPPQESSRFYIYTNCFPLPTLTDKMSPTYGAGRPGSMDLNYKRNSRSWKEADKWAYVSFPLYNDRVYHIQQASSPKQHRRELRWDQEVVSELLGRRVQPGRCHARMIVRLSIL